MLVDGLRNISLIYEGLCLCQFMKDFAFVKPGIYRFTLWYGNLNSRTLVCKENYIHYLFDAHSAFCCARSFASFGCPYYVLYLSRGFIASDDICKRDRLLYLGNCFNNCFAILTRASFCSFIRRWGIHLALILLIFKSQLRLV